MLPSDFDFDLPEELVAQQPAPARDESRLLVLDRKSKAVSHEHFPDILQHFQKGDRLVLNDSRVIPARLHGVNAQSGGMFEILMLEEVAINDWWTMMRPGKRARIGTRIRLRAPERSATPITAIVIDKNDEGHRRLQFECAENILNELEKIGETPLPPYIRRTKQLEAD